VVSPVGHLGNSGHMGFFRQQSESLPYFKPSIPHEVHVRALLVISFAASSRADRPTKIWRPCMVDVPMLLTISTVILWPSRRRLRAYLNPRNIIPHGALPSSSIVLPFFELQLIVEVASSIARGKDLLRQRESMCFGDLPCDGVILMSLLLRAAR